MGLNPLGRNWGSLVNWDSLGIAYTAFIVAWTIILFSGVFWFISNRNLPYIRIRNVPIAVLSVTFLHVYLVKILLAYTTNGHFLCSAEFWIMSIYLPFGIALFQANLMQLRSISDQQRTLMSSGGSIRSVSLTTTLRSPSRLWRSWSALPEIHKSYVYIGIAMFVQFIITAVLYATTPELQGDWTSYGDLPHNKGQVKCRGSYAWIPSAFWQMAWSWLYGPYILFKIRRIHDVHYWRLGVWLSVISGLPGAPLWCASVYSTGFKLVNPWWVPPMWLAPGIIVMQVVTIFFPMYEAFQSHRQMRTTLSTIKTWEDKRAAHVDSRYSSSETGKGSSYGDSSAQSSSPSNNNESTRSKEIYAMASLEKALVINPMPLLHFSATKDFTAENIIFLMRVKDWRSAWKSSPRMPGSQQLTDEARTQLFQKGLETYMTCVHDSTAEFPINIEGSIRAKLDSIFEHALPRNNHSRQSSSGGSDDFDAMFDFKQPSAEESFNHIALTARNGGGVGGAWETKQTGWTQMSLPSSSNGAGNESDDGDEVKILDFEHGAVHSTEVGAVAASIGPDFDATVFDAAEASIKYLVLTNTWSKFVRAGKANMLREMGLHTT